MDEIRAAFEAWHEKGLMRWPETNTHYGGAYASSETQAAWTAWQAAAAHYHKAGMELAKELCEAGLVNRKDDPLANAYDGGLRTCAAAIRAEMEKG